VVAFTDGENNKGRNLAAVQGRLCAAARGRAAIPVFMVLFGEAKEADLKDMVPPPAAGLRCAQDTAVCGVQGHPGLPMSLATMPRWTS
jgi:Ca-activated chloride channel family protein